MELFVETIPRWIYVFLSSYFIPQYDYLCALWTMYATQRKVINNEKYPPAQSSSNCERRIKIRNVFWCDPDMQPFLKALGNCSLSIDKLNKQSSVVDFISMYFFAGALSLSTDKKHRLVQCNESLTLHQLKCRRKHIYLLMDNEKGSPPMYSVIFDDWVDCEWNWWPEWFGKRCEENFPIRGKRCAIFLIRIRQCNTCNVRILQRHHLIA